MSRRSVSVATIIILAAAAIVFVTCTQEGPPKIPVAAKHPKTDTIHSTVMVDYYYWLRNKGEADVMAYLEAENDYTAAIMSHTENLQEELYREMRGHIRETDADYPVRDGDYYYYSRTEQGKQYKIYCRKHLSMDSPEQIILDLNKIADTLDYCYLGAYEVSHDHAKLAYSIDVDGSERYTLFIKDLETGEILNDRMSNTGYDIAWSADCDRLYYLTLDDLHRTAKLWRHRFGDEQTLDQMLLFEEDVAFDLSLYTTKDDDYIILSLDANETSEQHFLASDDQDGQFTKFAARQPGVQYDIHSSSDRWIVRTNLEAPNFKVVQTKSPNTEAEFWSDIIPHNDSIYISSIEIFDDFIVRHERFSGQRQVTVMALVSGNSHSIEFPEEVYTCYRGVNPNPASEFYRFEYMSPATPKTTFEYDMSDRHLLRRKQVEVPGGFDPNNYETKRIFAEAEDGRQIPISLLYKKSLSPDGSHPTYLNGYGSYGFASEPSFRPYRFALVDRGYIWAIAHVRGGGEMGRYWYDEGKLLNKKNTFTDFVAVAQKLVADGYTSPEQLAAGGGSAGGLLIGAIANMRPDLFRALVADVPFVDLINTMMDPTIPLTVTEYEEWGNPNDSTFFEYMLSYSPYDQVAAQEYPNMLITAGLNDSRVQYWEPAKWAAKLRSYKTDSNRLLLKTNMGAGHFGSSGRFEYLRELAFEYAFLIDVMKTKK